VKTDLKKISEKTRIEESEDKSLEEYEKLYEVELIFYKKNCI